MDRGPAHDGRISLLCNCRSRLVAIQPAVTSNQPGKQLPVGNLADMVERPSSHAVESRMKAITYATYGPPEVRDFDEVAKPVPKDDEVLIRVMAAEATKSDVEMRRFKFAVKWFWLPLRIAFGLRKPKRHILGGYFAGEIASIGKNVAQFSVGQQVFGAAGLRFGAYGEFVALPASYPIATKPVNMSFAEAAAVPVGRIQRAPFHANRTHHSGRHGVGQWRRRQHRDARDSDREVDGGGSSPPWTETPRSTC